MTEKLKTNQRFLEIIKSNSHIRVLLSDGAIRIKDLKEMVPQRGFEPLA